MCIILLPTERIGGTEQQNRPSKGRPHLFSGGAMVSTGTVRYDKRSGPDNPVKMSTLKLNDNNKVALAA